MDYQDQLRDLIAAGWTQAGLAKYLGAHYTTVNRWIHSVSYPHHVYRKLIDDLWKATIQKGEKENGQSKIESE